MTEKRGGASTSQPINMTRSRALARAARAHWKIIVLASVVDVLVAWLVAGAMTGPRIDYRVGDAVRSEIVVREPLSVVDVDRSEELRRQAEERVPQSFDYTPGRNAEAIDSLETSLENLRAAYEREAPERTASAPEAFARTHIADFPLGDEPSLEALARRGFDPDLTNTILGAVRRRTTGYIVGDEAPATPQLFVHSGDTGDAYPIRFREVVRLSEAKDGLSADLLRIGGLRAAEREQLAATLVALVAPTLVPNLELTARAREEARAAVPDVVDVYRTGDVIAYRNQPVDARIARALGAIARRSQTPDRLARVAGLLLFVATVLGALWVLTGNIDRSRALPRSRAFVLVSTLLLAQVALARLGVEIVARYAVAPHSPEQIAPQFLFAIPFAFAPLVVALLVDGMLALVIGIVVVPLVSLLTGMQYGGGTPIGMYAALGAAATVLAAWQYRSRLVVVLAGTLLFAANLVGVAVVTLLSARTTANLSIHLTNVGAAAVGALLASGLAALALPAAERAFHLLSDVRLLELAHADSPLLRELAIRAPGTHQHSYVMSSVATEAAKAIGADPLLVRVGAYYHDIGKLHAPDLFVENQQGGPNPHDNLDPPESARQIMRHVSYGVELAQDAGLPPQVIEMITGHHGTRTLHVFLEKAKQLAHAGNTVDESLFRYAGPKPQTRESAILMLADGCEAAVRSLDEPTREQVDAIVRKINDVVIADSQLDECGITFAELARVRGAIVDTLVNLHHRRVKYPGFNPPASESEREPASQ